MEAFQYFIVYLLGIATGVYVLGFILKLKLKREEKKLISKLDAVYSELSIKILDNSLSRFIFRINNHIKVESYLENIGKVDVYFYTNKDEVSIFKDDNIIYTSGMVTKNIIDSFLFNARTKFSLEIHDTVNVFGMIYSRSYFIETFNISPFLDNQTEQIHKEQNDNIDIDYILDKINLVGIEKLTQEEKEFLNKYSNKNNES